MNLTAKKGGFLRALPFLLPSLIGFVILRAVPIITSIFISLTDWDALHEMTLFSDPAGFMSDFFVGFDNFAKILSSPELGHVLLNTLFFIALYLPCVVFAGIAVANILNKHMKGVGFYRVLYYIPVITSWVAGALIWKWVLSPDYGIMNQILALFGINGPQWLQSDAWAMPSIALASIWKDVGYFGLIFLGGLQGINPSYYEAAQIDGAGPVKRFFKITLPLLSPVTFFVLVTGIISSFQVFAQVMVMTLDNNGVVGGPNGATQVLVERIYTYAFKYHSMGYASAYSWVLFVIIFIFTIIQLQGQKRWVNYDD